MKKMAWLLPLLLSFQQQAWPADDLMSSQLADQARSWQEKDRDDLAADLWRKLLRADPKHPEALVKLGLIEARAGNRAKAEALLNRARRLSPPPAGLNQLAAATQAQAGTAANTAPPPKPEVPVVKKDLPAPIKEAAVAKVEPQPQPRSVPAPEAPKAAAAPKPKDISDQPAAGKPAAGTVLKPLQTVSAINARWPETRHSLEELVREHPGNSDYLFALASHLSYRDATRREAIRQLAALTPQGAAKKKTRKVWRQALIALDGRAGDDLLYSAYLTRYPNDAAIDQRLRALDLRQVQTAPAEVRSRLVLSADVGKPDAVDIPNPTGNQGKAGALLRQALADEQGGAHGAAAAKLESAMLLDPLNPSVRVALARQYLRLGAIGGAESLLNDLLSVESPLPEALHVRALLYAAQQKWLEGLNTLERIAPARRTAAMAQDQRRMWLNVQVARARQLQAQGNAPQALALMEAAQAAARPDDAMFAVVAAGWSELGQSARALQLMRQFISASPMQDVATRIRYAEILQYARQDAELSAVLRDLAAPGRLNTAQQEEVNRIILAYTLRLAETMRESGQVGEAALLLDPVMQRSDDTRVLLALARIHRAASDSAQALALVEKAIVREPDELGHRLLASELALAIKELDKAGGQAKAALELAPTHPRALAAAGRVEKARGNLALAVDYFQRAHAMERDPGAFNGARGNLALRLVDQDRLPAAPAGKTPLAERTGLLPIPDAAPKGGRLPAAIYPVPDLYPDAELQRPAVKELLPPARMESGSKASRAAAGSVPAPLADWAAGMMYSSYPAPAARAGRHRDADYQGVRADVQGGVLDDQDGIPLKLTTSIDVRATVPKPGISL